MLVTKQLTVATDVHSMEENTIEVNGCQQFTYQHSSEYPPLCSEERNSYKFGKTWGRINDETEIFPAFIHFLLLNTKWDIYKTMSKLLFMMLYFVACQPLVTIHLHCLVDYNFFFVP